MPSARHQATWPPFLIVPLWTRQIARRPTYADASRLVTWACSGAPSSYSGAGIVSSSVSISGCSVVPGSVGREARLAGPRVRVDDRELDLALGGAEVDEQLVDLVDDLGDARVRAVDLVDHEDHRELVLERLAQHEARLRQRALGRVDQQQHAVDHLQPALHLAAEVGVAGRVDDVELDAVVTDRGVLREDRDALLALEIHRVHHAVVDVLVLAERAGLPEHGVHQRGLAVIDVGDDRDVSEV